LRRVDILALVAMAGWGIAYVPSAWLLEEWPILAAAGARFALGGVLLMGALALAGSDLRPGVGVGVVAWVSLTQTVLFYAAVFWGIVHAGAGLSALLSNTDPLFIAILAVLVLGERLTPRQWGGVVVGLVGTAVVVWDGPAWPPAVSFDAAIILGGALVWSIGTIAVARGVRDRARPLALAAWQMLVGGLALMGTGALIEGPPSVDGRAFALVALTAVVGAAVPMALFYLALVRAPAGEVSAWFFLVPVIGVLSAWVLLGETPDASLVFGLITISCGLWLVMARRVAHVGGLVKSPPPP
jgi:O-acetylserine/cysteine efflux transporter